MDAATQAVSNDLDTLSDLESRINRAVQAITSLRRENTQLQDRLKSTEAELATTKTALSDVQALSTEFQNDNNDLTQRLKEAGDELASLRGERNQVHSRLEKLVGQLDLLSAS